VSAGDSLLVAASRRGRLLREAAARADLLRATGPAYAIRHVVDERRSHAAEQRTGDAVYERMWRGAAAEVGASVETRPGGFLEIQRDGALTRVWRQWVPLDDAVTIRAALDRGFVHDALSRAGVPVPDHVLDRVDDLRAARALLAEHGAVVVKPAAGTGGGRGATASVRTQSQLLRAAILASRHNRELVVERRVAGDVYRILFLDGELLDLVRRLPPSVTGDGESTIRSLVLAENARRLRAGGDAGLPLVTANLDMVFTLEHAGRSLASVLAPHERVAVKAVTNQSGPEDNFTVREPVSDELISDARTAAAAVGVRLAGVDVITPSLDAGLRDAGGVVIEVNGGPGLHHHYHVAERTDATRVCVPVLERLLSGPARR
jgi:D-alanine-D-alanine ligase-like ATP-grasp enzyme